MALALSTVRCEWWRWLMSIIWCTFFLFFSFFYCSPRWSGVRWLHCVWQTIRWFKWRRWIRWMWPWISIWEWNYFQVNVFIGTFCTFDKWQMVIICRRGGGCDGRCGRRSGHRCFFRWSVYITRVTIHFFLSSFSSVLCLSDRCVVWISVRFSQSVRWFRSTARVHGDDGWHWCRSTGHSTIRRIKCPVTSARSHLHGVRVNICWVKKDRGWQRVRPVTRYTCVKSMQKKRGEARKRFLTDRTLVSLIIFALCRKLNAVTERRANINECNRYECE